mmetsp:Transcript_6009/g.10039  ORF Transcript_6009/g.10039 Transcript_6009/m.10039 type:complete len:103 (+) Transcript_6009:2255-2563(+)
MLHCPAGTYRGLAYDQVSECVSCPPNHWREDVKGKSLSSCRKCPANTSTRNRREALRFKIVSVAQRVQCQPKELPANALLLKHAMQINCPSQPMQKREVYLI